MGLIELTHFLSRLFKINDCLFLKDVTAEILKLFPAIIISVNQVPSGDISFDFILTVSGS